MVGDELAIITACPRLQNVRGHVNIFCASMMSAKWMKSRKKTSCLSSREKMRRAP